MHNVEFRTINGMLDQVQADGLIVVKRSKTQLEDFNKLIRANNGEEITRKADKIEYLMKRVLRGFRFLEDYMIRKSRMKEIGLEFSEDKDNIQISFDLFLMLGLERKTFPNKSNN